MPAPTDRLRILETVMSNLDSLISYMDTDLRYVYVNEAYSRWFNLSRAEVIGHSMIDVVGEQPVQKVRSYLDAALSGVQQEFDAQLNYKRRGPRSVHVRYIPDFDDAGKVIGLIVMVSDTTAFVERSDRFRDIYEVSPLAIGIFDMKARFLNANAAYQKLLGYSEDELRLMSVSDVTLAEDAELMPQAVKRAVGASGDYQRYEKRYVAKDGRILHVRVTGRMIPSENGEPKLLAICEDITAQKKTEDELKSAHDFNKAIIRSARSAIITTTLDGLITEFNEEASRIFGYRREDIVGIHTPKILHMPEEVVEAARLLSIELGRKIDPGFEMLTYHARRGGFEERYWDMRRQDGSRVPVRLAVSGLYDSSGKLTGFMGIATDVTEFKQLALQLEQERAKATHTAKLASLGEMSAGIAHEINNPLGIIMGSLPLLEKFKEDPDKFARKIENAAAAGKRIEKIVKGLRRFARTTEGSEHRDASLNEIVIEALTITEAKSKRHGTPVTTTFDGHPWLRCDGVEIEQVLVNLINNAIDANKHETERWVKIEVTESPTHALIRVTDSGRGISDEIEQKLFLPFFTTKAVGEGTGLGLSISKGIIDSHKGTLTLNRSTPNTCFEIQLPKLNTKVARAS